MCAAHNPVQTRPLSEGILRSPSRQSLASMRCLCRPDWACFFLFCLFSAPLPYRSTLWGGAGFSHQGFAVVPGFANNWPTRLQQGRSKASMVSFPLPGPQNRTQGHTGASLIFFPRMSLPLPPKGGGAGYRLSWVGRVGPARSKLGHACPTGPVTCFAGVAPLPGSQKRTQALTGPSLVLTLFSWCASFAAGKPSPAPACYLPPPGWDEW